MLGLFVVWRVWLLQCSLCNKQHTVLHICASGACINVAIANHLFGFTVNGDVNHVTLTALHHLKRIDCNIYNFSAFLRWVHLLNAGEAIWEAVVELRGGQFSLAASAADDIGHGKLSRPGKWLVRPARLSTLLWFYYTHMDCRVNHYFRIKENIFILFLLLSVWLTIVPWPSRSLV